MGALSSSLARAAERAGAELRTGVAVTSVEPHAVGVEVRTAQGAVFTARDLLANVAPALLARMLGEDPPQPSPEGSQLKLNMVLKRLPRLRDASVSSADAFTGTFHVNESYSQLGAAYVQAAAGQIPSVVPAEAYCHSLSDRSILSPELDAAGANTLTVFALHMPARLFRCGRPATSSVAEEFQPTGKGAGGPSDARLAELGTGRTDRGLSDGGRKRGALSGGPYAAGTRSRARAAGRKQSFTASSAGPTPSLPGRSEPGASRRPIRASGSAGRAPGVAVVSAASRATTRRWRCWRTEGPGPV